MKNEQTQEHFYLENYGAAIGAIIIVAATIVIISISTNTLMQPVYTGFTSSIKSNCQYTTNPNQSFLFQMTFFCGLNTTNATCSNMGGTNIPFITNKSYLNWPECNASQRVMINKNSTLKIIDD
jgi:hypothetical protein